MTIEDFYTLKTDAPFENVAFDDLGGVTKRYYMQWNGFWLKRLVTTLVDLDKTQPPPPTWAFYKQKEDFFPVQWEGRVMKSTPKEVSDFLENKFKQCHYQN